MARVQKTTSDIRLEAGTELLTLRVASVSFSDSSANSMIHRPRAGAAQAVAGHLTSSAVNVECYVGRADVDNVRAMVGQQVVMRFSSGGGCEGILTGVSSAGEPGSWEDETQPYVTTQLSVATTRQTAGLG